MAKQDKTSTTTSSYPMSNEVSERWVIGSIIKNPKLLDEIMVEPWHFYNKKHREIFEAILKIKQESGDITPNSIASNIPNSVESWVIDSILAEVTSSEQCSRHATNIVTAAQYRVLTHMANKITKDILNSKEPGEIISELQAELPHITTGSKVSRIVKLENPRKLNMDPPVYFIDVATIDGRKYKRDMRLTLEELTNKRQMQRQILAALDINPLLPKDYDTFVNNLVASTQEIEVPEEATRSAVILYWLRDWWNSAREAESVDDLNRGYVVDGAWYKIQPTEVVRRINETTKLKIDNQMLFEVLKPHGIIRDEHPTRLGNKSARLWKIPREFFEQQQLMEIVDLFARQEDVEDDDLSWL